MYKVGKTIKFKDCKIVPSKWEYLKAFGVLFALYCVLYALLSM